MRTAKVESILLKISDMKLELVDHRDDLTVIQDHLKVMGLEVAYADRAAFSFFIKLLHRVPGITDLLSPLLILRIQLRPVDQIQVDIVGPKLTAGSGKSFLRLFVSWSPGRSPLSGCRIRKALRR